MSQDRSQNDPRNEAAVIATNQLQRHRRDEKTREERVHLSLPSEITGDPSIPRVPEDWQPIR